MTFFTGFLSFSLSLPFTLPSTGRSSPMSVRVTATATAKQRLLCPSSHNFSFNSFHSFIYDMDIYLQASGGHRTFIITFYYYNFISIHIKFITSCLDIAYRCSKLMKTGRSVFSWSNCMLMGAMCHATVHHRVSCAFLSRYRAKWTRTGWANGVGWGGLPNPSHSTHKKKTHCSRASDSILFGMCGDELSARLHSKLVNGIWPGLPSPIDLRF